MKITNKYNLPQTIVNVLARPTYTKGKAHLSVTEAMSSPRIVQLRKRHWDDLEEDVADKVWAIFGTAIHSVLEQGKDEDHIIEQRIHTTVDGWNISGAVDLQRVEEDGIIVSDYKTTSAWAVMNEKSDWEQQLNIYAWLIEKVKQKPVKKIEIVAIIRDWSRRDSQVKANYPEAPIKVIDIKLWPFQQREDFITERVHLHAQAHMLVEMDEALPECTPEEMWEKQTTWALRKVGNIRAKSLHDTQEAAQNALEAAGKGFEVEVRLGERTRCANFCQVSGMCDQYQTYLSNQTKE
jgi:hypothetical protein